MLRCSRSSAHIAVTPPKCKTRYERWDRSMRVTTLYGGRVTTLPGDAAALAESVDWIGRRTCTRARGSAYRYRQAKTSDTTEARCRRPLAPARAGPARPTAWYLSRPAVVTLRALCGAAYIAGTLESGITRKSQYLSALRERHNLFTLLYFPAGMICIRKPSLRFALSATCCIE